MSSRLSTVDILAYIDITVIICTIREKRNASILYTKLDKNAKYNKINITFVRVKKINLQLLTTVYFYHKKPVLMHFLTIIVIIPLSVISVLNT